MKKVHLVPAGSFNVVYKFKKIPPEGIFVELDKELRNLLKDKLVKIVPQDNEKNKNVKSVQSKAKLKSKQK